MTGGNQARFAARPIEGRGTPLRDWLDWERSFPYLDLDDCPALLIVAPHPDDETLGLGATAASLRSRGVAVHVVVVSDGAVAYPRLSPLERRWLASDRRIEMRRAAAMLGLPAPVELGMPDGELAQCHTEITARLVELLSEFEATPWCAATWRGDGHPDHEAVGRAAVEAATEVGATVLGYPVWMWHWARPDDPDVPWHRLVRVPLDNSSLARKQHAINVFESQLRPAEPDLEPILPPWVVQRLLGVGEVVFR